jgi:serine O-acetyltransferase
MDLSEAWSGLQAACGGLAVKSPAIATVFHDTLLDASPEQGLARLLGKVLCPAWLSAADLVAIAQAEFERSPAVIMAAMEDLDAITGRNLESGGVAWTWIGNRGFHVLIAHRVIHALWSAGSEETALAVKASLASLGVDIHPAACFGQRIFLDHAIGLVVGETAVIEDDVSIWHGVTLGSTLMQSGDRHPKIRRGAIIGAGAIVLGNIEVGEGAIVASGSVVLRPVPPFSVVAGNPAAAKPGYRHPFGYPASSHEEIT